MSTTAPTPSIDEMLKQADALADSIRKSAFTPVPDPAQMGMVGAPPPGPGGPPPGAGGPPPPGAGGPPPGAPPPQPPAQDQGSQAIAVCQQMMSMMETLAKRVDDGDQAVKSSLEELRGYGQKTAELMAEIDMLKKLIMDTQAMPQPMAAPAPAAPAAPAADPAAAGIPAPEAPQALAAADPNAALAA